MRQNGFSFFKNTVTISEAWARPLPCRRRICLKPVTGVVSDIFRLLQYYVFVDDGLVMFLPFSTGTFIATPSPEKKIAYQTFLALKDRLTIIGRLLCLVAEILLLTFLIDSIFITFDDTGKLLFVISLKHLKQLFGHFNPLSVLLISQQMWHPSSKNISDFQMLLQNVIKTVHRQDSSPTRILKTVHLQN